MRKRQDRMFASTAWPDACQERIQGRPKRKVSGLPENTLAAYRQAIVTGFGATHPGS
jgi:hypothetical protein